MASNRRAALLSSPRCHAPFFPFSICPSLRCHVNPQISLEVNQRFSRGKQRKEKGPLHSRDAPVYSLSKRKRSFSAGGAVQGTALHESRYLPYFLGVNVPPRAPVSQASSIGTSGTWNEDKKDAVQ